ncbi:MAG: N-acetyl-lysine deacetylase [Anaerolineales bacterium]|nr:N-acetyl-lysine deacetylase [Anaerolineales bacterium]
MKHDMERLIEMAIAIQQIPAPTFAEGERAAFVREQLVAEKLNDVSVDQMNNVFARLPGKDATLAPLIVSAHLDTVFPAETDLRVSRENGRIYGPGIGDNSLGVASLFGLIWSLRGRGLQLPGDVWLVANVGEEGLGDLRGMKAVVERFGSSPRAYLILEGMAFGHVYHRAIGVHRYRINVTCAGGHAWSDYGKPSAVHELTSLASQIALLELPLNPRTTLNVGRIEGGTGVNVLAAHASLDLDMRSEDSSVLASLILRVDELIASANRPGVSVEAQVIGQRPAGQIPSNHPLVQLALQSYREQGVESNLIGGSTDANLPLSKGYPAVVMGITTGGGAHTLKEFVNVEPMQAGMQSVAGMVERVFQ